MVNQVKILQIQNRNPEAENKYILFNIACPLRGGIFTGYEFHFKITGTQIYTFLFFLNGNEKVFQLLNIFV